MRKAILAVLSLTSLCLCLLASVFYFLGTLSAKSYRLLFIGASIGWFVFATLWARLTKKV